MIFMQKALASLKIDVKITIVNKTITHTALYSQPK